MMNNENLSENKNLKERLTPIDQSSNTNNQPKIIQIPVQHVKSSGPSSSGTSTIPRIGNFGQSIFNDKSPFDFPDKKFDLINDFGFEDFDIKSGFDDPFFRIDPKSRLAKTNKQDFNTSKWQKESSPIPVHHNRNSHERNPESPKRFTTQTTIYPNLQSQKQAKPQEQQHQQQGVPIKVQHLQTESKLSDSNKSDFKYTESENGSRQPSPPEDNKMGSTMSNGANKQSKMNASDFKTETKTTPPSEQPKPESRPMPQPPKVAKSPQQKCEEVKSELENLEKEIESFSGAKTDRSYRRLEELLTRCLLKLDEIEKGDESFNQFRKGLINYANKIGEILDSKGNVQGQSSTNIKSVENASANADNNADTSEQPIQVNKPQDSNQTPNTESIIDNK